MPDCANCGNPIQTRIYNTKDGKRRLYTPSKYCSLKCSGAGVGREGLGRKAISDNARGWHIDKQGYILLRKDENGYQKPAHRAVMEAILGRKLAKHETVHHKNGIRHDNRPENLELWFGNHGNGQRSTEQDIWSGMIPQWLLEEGPF